MTAPIDPLESNIRWGLNCPPVPIGADVIGPIAREDLLAAAGLAAIWRSLSNEQRDDVYRADHGLYDALSRLQWMHEDGEKRIKQAADERAARAPAPPRAS